MRRVGLSRTVVMRWARIMLALLLLGSSGVPAITAQRQAVALIVAGWMYDLTSYEVQALGTKVGALIQQPAQRLTGEQASELVRDYMARAVEIGRVERELARRASGATASPSTAQDAELVQQLADLRHSQDAVRSTVEQVIQRQVTSVLADAGFGVDGAIWPPVQFAFVEPPKKLIVSRRDRIYTIDSHMLAAQIPLSQIEAAEAAIDHLSNSSGYITDIGGLGAYPAMVVDQASLEWVLSTVAHEWVHNYLVFFPLGWRYFAGQELTTMNETVAEIVGNEIGSLTLARYYPDLAPPPASAQGEAPPTDAPAFDFDTEMRATRLAVDRLLGEGRVTEAESYMEARRQLFVEQGYPLRVLNQAYFAFHGSYGTSPASTDPIGPQMRALRAKLPGIMEFLHTVRWYTQVDDLTRDVGGEQPTPTP